jgi:hypothetical protein
MTILPLVNASSYGDPANSAGSTGLENMYFIDGVNVTEPLSATGGTSLPYNFIKSVEVRSGGYEAQYGRALGAIVNAVTYSGSNQLEGSVFAFVSPGALSSSARGAPTLSESNSFAYDAGVRLSGPLVKDRLWFSTAYNPRVSRVDRTIGRLGTFTDHSRADAFAVKLTAKPSATADVTLSLFGDPAVEHQVAPCLDCGTLTPLTPDPYLHHIETGGVSGALQGSFSPTPSFLLEGAISRSTGRSNFEGDTERARQEALLLDYVQNTVTGGLDLLRRTRTRSDGATWKATWVGESHRVMLGGELFATTVERNESTGGRSRFIRRTTDGYLSHLEAADGHFQNRSPAVFLQDSWRPSEGWMLNAGLRWSRQQFFGTRRDVAQRFSPEWQPRVGFSRQFGALGAQRVFGSYGRYYQTEPLNLATGFYVDYLFREWNWNQDPRLAGAAPIDSVDFSSKESDFTNAPGRITSERFDEVTLGYERVIGSTLLTLRGVHRHLGTAFVWGIDPASATFFVLGTPGSGNLSFLPQFRRDYTAFVADVVGQSRSMSWRASYVLSRNRGNYPGLFGQDYPSIVNPGVNYGLATADQVPNSTGALPNDRPHVVKLSGAWRLPDNFELGSFMMWQAGTPLNEFGIGSIRPITRFPTFLVSRGSAGRTPSTYDVNVRLSHTSRALGRSQARTVLDIMHVGNPRTAVQLDQQHYLAPTPSAATENPNYRRAIAFQPPMAARLGLEVAF